jgi:hypothetical protein
MKNEQEVVDASRRMELLAVVVNLGLQVISTRSLTILTLLLDAGIFAWAMSADSWIRLTGATIFTFASWCIVNLRPPKEQQNES